MEKFIKEFILQKQLENLSKKTTKAYYFDLCKANDFYVQNTLDIQQCLIEYIKVLCQNEAYKANTKKRKLITLKMFWNYLQSNKHITPQNFPNAHIRKEKRLPKTLSTTEITKLLTVVSSYPTASIQKKRDQTRDIAIFEVMINLGLRISEVSNISIQDYSFEDGTLIIHGKNNKDRILYLTNSLSLNILTNYLKIRSAYSPQPNENALFLNKYGNQLSVYGISNIYKKYKKMASINVQSTPHYLRHTFATELLNNGANLRDIQELLGHSSITTTEIYTAVSSTRKKKVLDEYGIRKNLT